MESEKETLAALLDALEQSAWQLQRVHNIHTNNMTRYVPQLREARIYSGQAGPFDLNEMRPMLRPLGKDLQEHPMVIERSPLQ